MFWVVGQHGQLSSAFSRLFKDNNYYFIATDRAEVDVTKASDVNHFFDSYPITHVFNASGYTNVEQAEDEWEKAMHLNHDALEILANRCLRSKAKLIHFSTDYVFNGKKKTLYLETDPTCPLNAYGKSKALGEQKLLEILPEALVMRVSWLFGKEGHNFVKTMVDLMKTKESIKVVSDQVGRPTYTNDVVKIVLRALSFSGIYHLCNKEIISWYDFAQDIYRKLKELNVEINCQKIIPIKTCLLPQKARRPSFSALSVEKIEKQLGFEVPSYTSGLRQILMDIKK